MSRAQRSLLVLAAFPSSAALATLAFVALDGDWLVRLIVAAGLFAVSELLLAHGVSRIPARVGPEAMIGRRAEVLSEFVTGARGACTGYVRLDGERWQARVVSPLNALPETGDQVKVDGVENLTLLVSRAPGPRGAPRSGR